MWLYVPNQRHLPLHWRRRTRFSESSWQCQVLEASCVSRGSTRRRELGAAMQQGLLHEAPIWSDVTTFNGRPWRGLVDELIRRHSVPASFVAGLRLAEDDERDLWSPARRIIVQSRPTFVFIENVGGLVTSGGLARLWRDVRRLGYSIEVGLFTASRSWRESPSRAMLCPLCGRRRNAGLEGRKWGSSHGERHGPASSG